MEDLHKSGAGRGGGGSVLFIYINYLSNYSAGAPSVQYFVTEHLFLVSKNQLLCMHIG